MPHSPLDYLKQIWSMANTPMVPQSAIQPAQDLLDSPSLDRSPLEASIRGFGAGALEGVRGLTTPLNMGAMAIPALRALGRGRTAAAPMGPAQPMQTLGEQMAEFTPVGGEAAYNATRPSSQIKPTDIYELVKGKMGGRGRP